ncbi:MAG: hypothetical protein SVR94_11735 [Pseudomonadota bacterium]|nr:hypothetical protein [Pseudomonadota bacterium]
MKAIEFKSKIQEGTISLPEHLQEWFDKSVRVILLADDISSTQEQDASVIFHLLTSLSEDFMENGRQQLSIQTREEL